MAGTLKSFGTDDESSVSFSPDGAVVASGSDDKTVKLWEVVTGECFRTLEGHKSFVLSVSFSPSGKILASSVAGTTIWLWAVSSGQCVRTLETPRSWKKPTCFIPDGTLLASGFGDHTIRVYDIDSGRCVQTLEGHEDGVLCLAFSADGTQLASGSEDKTVKVWSVENWHYFRSLAVDNPYFIRCVAFSPSETMVLASGSDDCFIRVWDIDIGKCVRTLKGHSREVLSICYSPNGLQLASGSDDGCIRLWNIATGNCVVSLKARFGGLSVMERKVAEESNTEVQLFLLAELSEDSKCRIQKVLEEQKQEAYWKEYAKKTRDRRCGASGGGKKNARNHDGAAAGPKPCVKVRFECHLGGKFLGYFWVGAGMSLSLFREKLQTKVAAQGGFALKALNCDSGRWFWLVNDEDLWVASRGKKTVAIEVVPAASFAGFNRTSTSFSDGGGNSGESEAQGFNRTSTAFTGGGGDSGENEAHDQEPASKSVKFKIRFADQIYTLRLHGAASLSGLTTKIQEKLNTGVAAGDITVKARDEVGDWCTLTDNEDLQEALQGREIVDVQVEFEAPAKPEEGGRGREKTIEERRDKRGEKISPSVDSKGSEAVTQMQKSASTSASVEETSLSFEYVRPPSPPREDMVSLYCTRPDLSLTPAAYGRYSAPAMSQGEMPSQRRSGEEKRREERRGEELGRENGCRSMEPRGREEREEVAKQRSAREVCVLQ